MTIEKILVGEKSFALMASFWQIFFLENKQFFAFLVRTGPRCCQKQCIYHLSTDQYDVEIHLQYAREPSRGARDYKWRLRRETAPMEHNKVMSRLKQTELAFLHERYFWISAIFKINFKRPPAAPYIAGGNLTTRGSECSTVFHYWGGGEGYVLAHGSFLLWKT